MFRFSFAALLLLTACDKENNPDCVSFGKAPVIAAEIPDSGAVDVVSPINITFVVNNGCGEFGHIEETVSENLITLSIIAKYSGCACSDDLPMRTITYNFVAPTPGVFVIQFDPVNEGSIIRDTLFIQ